MIDDPVAAGLMTATGVLWLLIAALLVVIGIAERDGWRLLLCAVSACVLIALWSFEAASHLT